jgi:hypothetical protein
VLIRLVSSASFISNRFARLALHREEKLCGSLRDLCASVVKNDFRIFGDFVELLDR